MSSNKSLIWLDTKDLRDLGIIKSQLKEVDEALLTETDRLAIQDLEADRQTLTDEIAAIILNCEEI